uniref:[histone H3]-trimethyl-L-lysine(9) demethylase n=1 Tax=Parascaris univalens TaxID=6257 RepID=A0A915AS92_PARUN
IRVINFRMMEVASTSGIPGHPHFISTGTVQVPVFYPSMEEMRDFPSFLSKVEQQHHAHLTCGIAKVSTFKA